MNTIFQSINKFFRFKNSLRAQETILNNPPHLKSENKWLNPKDNFGVLERGKAWSKD